MKKKMLAIAMAVAMMASLSSLAFAANTESGATTIKVDVPKAYTVTIPATGNASTTAESELTFSAKDVILAEGDTLQIKVTESQLSASDGKSHTVTAGFKYGAAYASASALTNSVVATLTYDSDSHTATDTNKMFIDKVENASYAGTYTGTLNFTVALVEATT